MNLNFENNYELSRGTEIPVVLIAGTSGSGKTTVAEGLVESFGDAAACLALDSYEKLGTDCVIEDDGYINWENPVTRDFDRLLDNISDLRCGLSTEVPDSLLFRPTKPGDCVAITYGKIDPPELLVLEGHLLLWDPRIRAVGSLAVFLRNSDNEHRVERRLHSSQDSYYDSQYFYPGEREYVLPTEKFADYSVDSNDLSLEEIVSQISNSIKDLRS